MTPDSADRPRHVVLAAIDDSEAAAEVVRGGAREATYGGGELHLVHCLPLPLDAAQSTTRTLERGRQLLERMAEQAVGPSRVMLHLAAGAAWLEIVQLAANLHADLIVVGTHNYSTLKRLVIGSVAEQVVRKASCPVLVMRGRDYHASSVPEILPPCADCLSVQRSSRGARLWCERHSTRHARGRLHYQLPEGFGEGSMLLRGSD